MNIEQTNNAGIKCDNPNCDFTDKESPDSELPKWLGVPCPKCGENLLTQEDLDSSIIFHKAIDFMNTLTEDEINEMVKSVYGDNIPDELIGNECVVDIHNGIKIKVIK